MPLVDADEGGDLLDRVTMVRRQMATELGLSLAPIRIRDNIQLGSHDYAVKIKGVEVARWSLMPGQLLAMNPGTAELPLDGLPTVEPSFGLPAVWIGEAQREQAEISGYTVVDPTSLVVTHLSEVIRRNAAELLGPPGRAQPPRRPQGALPGPGGRAGARPDDRRRGAARPPDPAARRPCRSATW